MTYIQYLLIFAYSILSPMYFVLDFCLTSVIDIFSQSLSNIIARKFIFSPFN